jgi:hypothetical protein
MTMREWIAKLDSFLRLSDRDLLTHAGTITHDAALAKAQSEFDKFRAIEDAKPQPVDVDFENAIEQAKQIAASQGEAEAEEGDGMIGGHGFLHEERLQILVGAGLGLRGRTADFGLRQLVGSVGLVTVRDRLFLSEALQFGTYLRKFILRVRRPF